ncbi:hypothetical protein Enr17x_34030 [Gimesia fumaroli]|uniref:Uncharacterized protein n=1 Tax=Gimesia fumaroli TaxID=2527976 RepID=A0A518IE58_9PLAN|nr:hypothetical protein Enr17x_34030 [Gimesia fumaroli]
MVLNYPIQIEFQRWEHKKGQRRMALPLFFEFVFAQRLQRDAVTVLIF